jgi:DNA-binding GntR family transcriptional regulator
MVRQEEAYARLKEAILSLQLLPGEPVPETEWAERLGMSRTPIREALRRLEYEGLVTSERRRGWFVYSLSLDEIRHIFDVKVALEGFAARLAAERITGEQAARLNRALEEIALATEEQDLDAWHEADQHFHGVLFDAAGNPRLQQIVSGLNDQLHRIRAGHLALKGRMDRSLEEHRAIAEAVLSGDGQAAEEVMRAHLRDLRESVIGVLEDLIVPVVGHRL